MSRYYTFELVTTTDELGKHPELVIHTVWSTMPNMPQLFGNLPVSWSELLKLMLQMEQLIDAP